MLGNFWKIAEADATQTKNNEPDSAAAFAVSSRPLVPHESLVRSLRDLSQNYENLGELPRSYGRPVLFAIARDPHTLFVYWEIDWRKTFGNEPPADRKVHLRVICDDGSEEARIAVEPFAGNHSVTVTQARSVYRIELGYDAPGLIWKSVATSAAIATPPDDVSESADIDVATVPFHLSFQHMIDSFRASKFDGEALVDMVSQLQERADYSAEGDLTNEEREVLRAIECTLSDTDATQRSRLRKVGDAFAMRQKIESILGFGGSSQSLARTSSSNYRGAN